METPAASHLLQATCCMHGQQVYCLHTWRGVDSKLPKGGWSSMLDNNSSLGYKLEQILQMTSNSHCVNNVQHHKHTHILGHLVYNIRYIHIRTCWHATTVIFKLCIIHSSNHLTTVRSDGVWWCDLAQWFNNFEWLRKREKFLKTHCFLFFFSYSATDDSSPGKRGSHTNSNKPPRLWKSQWEQTPPHSSLWPGHAYTCGEQQVGRSRVDLNHSQGGTCP